VAGVITPSGRIKLEWRANTGNLDLYPATSYADDSYHLFTAQVNQTMDYGRFYIDGAYVPQDAFSSLRDYNTSLYVGGAGSAYYHDLIDEFRISNTARSDAWIKATNDNLLDNLISYSASAPPAPGEPLDQDIQYNWDAVGNLTDRDTLLGEDTLRIAVS
jgi:hypothetical protein